MSKDISYDDFGICISCSNFRLLKFKGHNRYKKDCREVDIENTPPVSECKFYFKKSWQRLDDLREVAWELDTHKKESIGFKPQENKANGERRFITQDPFSHY
ncbi:MAG: hypothetical protein AABY22_08660 [Nanoarchaeota archaeon]